jgi:hypothetical protein
MSQKHVVEAGECLTSIARLYGFVNWRVIYDAADNAALRKLRPNPELLAPGDEVAIPDKTVSTITVGKGPSVDTTLKQEKAFLRIAVLRRSRQEGGRRASGSCSWRGSPICSAATFRRMARSPSASRRR